MTPPELLLREAEFQARRRRVLRALNAWFAIAGLGLLALFVARALAPGAFHAVLVGSVITMAAAGLSYAVALRRHWRCPACGKRWQTSDLLAAVHWRHCASCGAELRRDLPDTPQERAARTTFAQEDLPREVWAARFRARRRRCGAIVAGLVVAGLASLFWVSHRGLGEFAQQGVAALFSGLALATGVLGSRCPRCRTGFLPARTTHCQRCGLSLEAGGDQDP